MTEALVAGDGFIRMAGAAVAMLPLGRGGINDHKSEGGRHHPGRKAGPAPGAVPCGPGERHRRHASPWSRSPPTRAGATTRRIPATTASSVYPTPPATSNLWRDDGVYDIVGVLGWNDAPVIRGLGSAIFLHIARPDYAPTEGCIALAGSDLRELLAAGLSAVLVAAPG